MPTMKIEQEEFNCNPRKEWDNLATMVCWHPNYTLGDDEPEARNGTWLSYKLVEFGLERTGVDGWTTEPWDDFIYDLENDDGDAMRKAWKMLADKWIILPLYLYDHSGLWMSTSKQGWPFNCPWDTSTVGWIYVSKDKLREEFGWKRITKQRHEKAVQLLRNEVSTYSTYLSGDVWYYVIEDDDGVHLDGCGGLFEYDYAKKQAEKALAYWNKLAFFDWLFDLFRNIEEAIEEEIDDEERAMAQVGPTLMYA